MLAPATSCPTTKGEMLQQAGAAVIKKRHEAKAVKAVSQPGRRTMADVAIVAGAKAADDSHTLLTAPFRAPSFRDLQRSAAFLQGRLSDALTANEALNEANEVLRTQAKEEAVFAGRLAQDAAAAEASARSSEAAQQRDATRLQEAAVRNATVGNHAQHLEQRLLEASAREERLLNELRAARDDVSDARSEVADLRGEKATLNQALKQCEAEREEALSRLAATQTQLASTRSDFAAESRALTAVRSEAEDLREQCNNAARALQAARSANVALNEQCRRSEQEASVLASRAQEAAADALNESEARSSAERMAFALREQHAALSERRYALENQLRFKDTQHKEARKEVHDVGAEAHALAIRMGLYRAVLKSDLRALVR